MNIRPDDIPKTTFRTRPGQHEFLVMSFEFTYTHGTFISLMNKVFKPFVNTFVIVYIDEILAYSKSEEDHVNHIRTVTGILGKQKIYAKFPSVNFC